MNDTLCARHSFCHCKQYIPTSWCGYFNSFASRSEDAPGMMKHVQGRPTATLDYDRSRDLQHCLHVKTVKAIEAETSAHRNRFDVARRYVVLNDTKRAVVRAKSTDTNLIISYLLIEGRRAWGAERRAGVEVGQTLLRMFFCSKICSRGTPTGRLGLLHCLNTGAQVLLGFSQRGC